MLIQVAALLVTAALMLGSPAHAADYVPNYTLDAAVAQGKLDLNKATRPNIGLFGSYFEDANRISLLQGGIEAGAFPVYGIPLGMRVHWGDIHQDSKGARPSTDYDRLAAILDIGEVYLTPAFGLLGRLNYEGFDGNDETLWGGRLDARYHMEDKSLIGVWAARESFWMDQDRRNPRVYNRLIDLSQLDDKKGDAHPGRPNPDMIKNFRMHRAGAYADIRTRPGQTFHIEGGGDALEDDNSRLWAYTHYQMEILDSREGHWTAIKPNIYVEFNDKRDPAYFSPSNHITAGLMFHAVRNYGNWTLEGELNPQVLSTEGKGAVGAHAAFDASYAIGNASVGCGVFGYADTGDYWLWRSILRVGYTF